MVNDEKNYSSCSRPFNWFDFRRHLCSTVRSSCALCQTCEVNFSLTMTTNGTWHHFIRHEWTSNNNQNIESRFFPVTTWCVSRWPKMCYRTAVCLKHMIYSHSYCQYKTTGYLNTPDKQSTWMALEKCVETDEVCAAFRQKWKVYGYLFNDTRAQSSEEEKHGQKKDSSGHEKRQICSKLTKINLFRKNFHLYRDRSFIFSKNGSFSLTWVDQSFNIIVTSSKIEEPTDGLTMSRSQADPNANVWVVSMLSIITSTHINHRAIYTVRVHTSFCFSSHFYCFTFRTSWLAWECVGYLGQIMYCKICGREAIFETRPKQVSEQLNYWFKVTL